MTKNQLAAFLIEEHLPDSFQLTVERVCKPLAARARELHAGLGHTAVVGLCGAQGSGKSTIAVVTVRILQEYGLRAVSVSLDDFYLGRDARARLAATVHPLLAVRGAPGTHDVALACAVLDGLKRTGLIPLPSFDKGRDEPTPADAWRRIDGPVDVVVFEGWCVGAVPEPEAHLETPINDLEHEQDPDGIWRRWVNRQLAEVYPTLFKRLDVLVLLAAPGFEVVEAWRTEQEHKLRARTRGGMSDEEVARFVQHYERLTRWILGEMPGRADWTVHLAADRTPATP